MCLSPTVAVAAVLLWRPDGAMRLLYDAALSRPARFVRPSASPVVSIAEVLEAYESTRAAGFICLSCYPLQPLSPARCLSRQQASSATRLCSMAAGPMEKNATHTTPSPPVDASSRYQHENFRHGDQRLGAVSA